MQWRHLGKSINDIILGDDTPLGMVKMYHDLRVLLDQTHSDAITICPDFKSLRPTDAFTSRILPPMGYINYGTALAFYTKLSGYIRIVVENTKFACLAPAARNGLSFTLTNESDGFVCLFGMLHATMRNLGVMGFCPQKMIDSLLLANGDNVYTFMHKVLQVEETIDITGQQPPVNSLISQVVSQFSLSVKNRMILALIKTDFVAHVHSHTMSVPFVNSPATIQSRLWDMDAPLDVRIFKTQPVTPSTQCTVLPALPSEMVLNATSDSESEDGLGRGPHLHSLRPATRPDSQRHLRLDD